MLSEERRTEGGTVTAQESGSTFSSAHSPYLSPSHGPLWRDVSVVQMQKTALPPSDTNTWILSLVKKEIEEVAHWESWGTVNES